MKKNTAVKPPKKAPPLLVADQRKVTVYYKPEELNHFHNSILAHNDVEAYKVKHARLLKALGALWQLDPALQAKARRFMAVEEGK